MTISFLFLSYFIYFKKASKFKLTTLLISLVPNQQSDSKNTIVNLDGESKDRVETTGGMTMKSQPNTNPSSNANKNEDTKTNPTKEQSSNIDQPKEGSENLQNQKTSDNLNTTSDQNISTPKESNEKDSNPLQSPNADTGSSNPINNDTKIPKDNTQIPNDNTKLPDPQATQDTPQDDLLPELKLENPDYTYLNPYGQNKLYMSIDLYDDKYEDEHRLNIVLLINFRNEMEIVHVEEHTVPTGNLYMLLNINLFKFIYMYLFGHHYYYDICISNII